MITFSPEATPFPNVDTNPLIFFIRNAPPQAQFLWVKCYRTATNALKRWVRSGLKNVSEQDLFVIARDLKEGLSTGLSREPFPNYNSKYVLGDFVRVMRGIATGANDFFFMTVKKARELEVPEEYLIRAIGRTRDILGDEITFEVVRSVCLNPQSTEDILNLVDYHSSFLIKEAILKNFNCPVSFLCDLASDKDPNIRLGVARNLNSTKDILYKLSLDDDVCVRRAVAKHPNCDRNILSVLINDSDSSVSEIAFKRKSVNSSVL